MEQQYLNRLDTDTETIISKSRFIAYIRRTPTEESAKAFISDIKNLHKGASHNCSAYIIGESALIQKADDDGEPGGTAGVPILEVLKQEGMYDTTIVVTRYFGGIKLGGGGLIRAYSGAASSAVKASGKVVKIPVVPMEVTMEYTNTSRFEHYLGETDIEIRDTTYTDRVTYLLHVKEADRDAFTERLQEITKNTHDLDEHDVIQAEGAV
ncbi:ABC transporter [Salinicoccus sediminis]|uniref:ABC transporter n=1 Tax=Salinicoccus sediminis TaxID=1432562 RepID=A0A0M2SPD0_9STAP|nr:YigZ family protein [Salinicoccus sediminis]KKK34485.1 ABC transporter [Salinicoccus sediminis]